MNATMILPAKEWFQPILAKFKECAHLVEAFLLEYGIIRIYVLEHQGSRMLAGVPLL